MKTYRIPNTDLDVTRLAYGTWHIGGSWDHTPPTDEVKKQAAELLYAAVDQGINFIDLADIYTHGKSDSVIGDALKNKPGLRDQLILQEKCGIIIGDATGPSRYDFSYEHIISAVEGSLNRLQTDRVELLLLHRPDALVEPEEVARAFDHLQQSGKVRYFGVSNHSAAQIALLKRYIDQPLVVNQLELNLLHNHLIADGVIVNNSGYPYSHSADTLEYCRLNDIMIQAWSPVAGGQLFKPSADAPDNVKATAHLIAELADKHQTTREAIALGWLLRHPAGIQPIIGTMNVQRIADSCRADTVELSRIEWYQLLAAARGAGVP